MRCLGTLFSRPLVVSEIESLRDEITGAVMRRGHNRLASLSSQMRERP
jgi:hypothetical protein